MNRVLTTLATLALLGGVLAGTALAHARYAASYPQPGQTLTSAPASVAITYTEELASGSTGVVTNAGGATVSTGASINLADRHQMVIALAPRLPNGLYTVNWHTVSADDGDSLDGVFYFGVNAPVTVVTAPPTVVARASNLPATSTSTPPTNDMSGLTLALLVLAAVLVLVSTHALRTGKALS